MKVLDAEDGLAPAQGKRGNEKRRCSPRSHGNRSIILHGERSTHQLVETLFDWRFGEGREGPLSLYSNGKQRQWDSAAPIVAFKA